MPTFEIEFEVYCSCGEGLCNQSVGELRRENLRVTVEPCEKCLKKEKDDGWEEGYNKGYEIGYDKGYAERIKDGTGE